MKGVVQAFPQLRAAGFEIELWCWNCDSDVVAERIVKLPRFGRIGPLALYAFSFWARLRRWWRHDVRKETRPDLIYSVAWYLPRCDVCHVHFSPWDWQRRQRGLGMDSLRDFSESIMSALGRMFATRFMRATTARTIVSVSRAIADDLREATPVLNARVRVLPNSYDAGRFHPGVRAEWRQQMRTQLGYDAAESVFIFVSTGHYRRKGFFLAAEAIAILRTRLPAVRFLVVGGRKSRLRALQSRLDMKHSDWREWMSFTGDVPDVERYFAAADGLLFPSYSEAFALVEIEAAACGLPLFLTRHHGSEMILEDGSNGRWLDFDADKIAVVLAEFVYGRWKPTATGLSHALNSSDYARRLINILHDSAATIKTDVVLSVSLPKILL